MVTKKEITMSDFAIVTDSSCDLPWETVKSLGLTVLPLSFIMGGKEYKNYPDNRSMSSEEFYTRIRKGELSKTSAVNVESFKNEMEKILKEGKDVLNIAFSSGLSNTFNAAKIACDELSEKYRERKIFVVDTLSASLGQGLLVYLAAKKKEAGETITDVRDWLEKNKLNLCHWFTVDDLKHLKRGGRISAAAALVGTMLSIKPVLHVDNEGRLVAVSKVRGRRASLNALVDQMEKTAIEPSEQTVFISHGDCPDDAEYVAGEIKRRMGVKNILINTIGPVIGTHSGPGTLALFFLGTQR